MFLLKLYQRLSALLKPVLYVVVQRRIKRGKEDASRIQERFGIASCKRPQGQLVWIHAASVGEARSVLILIERLLQKFPHWSVLVTTHTTTAAEMMAKELPKQAVHQYIPYDHPQWVGAFLKHWDPNLVLWVESELWPGFLTTLGSQKIPIVLINGRISHKAFSRWRKLPSLAQMVLSQFSCCLMQTEQDAKRVRELGANNVHVLGNLKYAAHPVGFDAAELKTLQTTLQNRPLWVAASTHPGEEDIVLTAHRQVLQTFANALCVIVPRHPQRGMQICNMVKDQGFECAQRSLKESMHKSTVVYVVDTLGDLGLFYALADVTFVGGSLVPIGGHNLIEPAQLGCAIIHGHHMHKSRQLAEDFKLAKAAVCVKDGQELAHQVTTWLGESSQRQVFVQAASDLVAQYDGLVDGAMQHIEPYLGEGLADAQSA